MPKKKKGWDGTINKEFYRECYKDIERWFYNIGENKYFTVIFIMLVGGALLLHSIPQIGAFIWVFFCMLGIPILFPNKHNKVGKK